MNIAELLVAFAERCGIDRSFTLTGGMAMYLNKALNDSKTIETIFVHHEQAAISAAEGYSKARNFNTPGLACVTSGPAVGNTVNGLLSAYSDSTPILILAGQNKSSDKNVFGVRSYGVQEVPSEEIITPIVKKFISINPQTLNQNLIDLYENLYTGRPGPVFVEIPLDFQAVEVNDAKDLLDQIFTQKINSTQSKRYLGIQEVIEAEIRNASRVVFYLGNGLRMGGIETTKLIEKLDEWNVPRVYSWISQDLEDSRNNLNMGCPGGFAPIYSNQTIQGADLVIFLGARLDLATTAYQPNSFGSNGRRIIVDIDPNELSKFAKNKNTILINYDLRNGLDFLGEVLQSLNNQANWAQELSKFKIDYLLAEDDKLVSKELTVRQLAKTISKKLTEGILVPASSGSATEMLHRFLALNGKVRCFIGSSLGSMGHGLPQGIGAAASRSSDSLPVWVVEADGGLWMTIHELATLKNMNPKNFHIIIMNNNGYASISNSQKRHLNFEFGSTPDSGLWLPNWEKIAELFDFKYSQVHNLSELEKVLSSLTAITEISIVDVRLPKDENRGPHLKTTINNGVPSTQPLADLDW
jgi:acetolactate synthase-1/2/3 large subunit